jgi:hypothetical protein
MRPSHLRILLLSFSFILFNSANAQLTTLPDGGNKQAMVGERIGLTDVTIHYNRPRVKKREGKIWGQLIPVGFTDQGFGNSTAAPWRAGANENTTIEFTTQVMVEGKPLPAGKYALFIAYDSLSSTIIFSKNNSSWGSFFYNPAEDALRVKVAPVKKDISQEWLQYHFTGQTDSSAVVVLLWEKTAIPFTVTVDLNANQLESFRKELQSDKGFIFQTWTQAAQWCAQKNTNLNQALAWADSATSENFGGARSFQSWYAKSQVLEKLGRSNESQAAIKKAISFGGELELIQYADQLKDSTKAMEIYQINYQRNPDDFYSNFGMAEGYSRLGNYKKALEYARKSLAQAPSPGFKDFVSHQIKTLEDGKDFTKQ